MKLAFRISTYFIFIVSESIAQFNIIPVNVDYATFNSNSEKTYTEVYVSLLQKNLTYQLEDSLYVAHFTKTIKIVQNDSVMAQITRNYRNSVIEQEKLNKNNQFIDVFPFELQPGTYQLNALIIDQLAQVRGAYSTNLDIPDYRTGLALSKIELSTKIGKAKETSNFSFKNNIEIYPHPSCVFSLIHPVMYFYFEAYNLEIDSDGRNSYRYHYFISDNQGNVVRNFQEKSNSTDTTTIAEAGGINIIAFPADDFHLHIELIDDISGDSSSISKNFTVVRPSQQRFLSQSPVNIEDYIAMSIEEMRAEFERASYIATSEEKDIFNELNVDGMRRFLQKFWKIRDADPSTPLNEFKQTYFENIAMANTRYSTTFKQGWRTDRGRVLLLYGRPDEIERNPSSIDTKPYETWFYYSLDGGVKFIFGDVSGFGEYELMHSTHRNEIQDPNWRARIGSSRDIFDY